MSIKDKKSIEDVLECEKCGNDLAIYEDAGVDFGLDGEGFYSAHCWCPACNAHAKVYINFKYEITKTYSKYWGK